MYIVVNKHLTLVKKEELDKETIKAFKNKEINIIWFPTEESDKEPLAFRGILDSGIKQFGFIHE